MSIRGTACFALGLISRTSHGFAMLMECGWETTTDANGKSLGFCLPRDPSRLCLQPHDRRTAYEERQRDQHEIDKYKAATTDTDSVHAKILKLVVDMGNSVNYKKVPGELQGVRVKQQAAFTSVQLFQKTLYILQSHHYRLQARQFILDLFDKNVMRQIVLEEDDDDESDGEDTG